MNIAEATIVNLYETNCISTEDIQTSLELPLAYILDVLERKSAKYRALAKDSQSNGSLSPHTPISVSTTAESEDIPDKMFARVREEMFNLALAPDQNPFLKASCLKFLWNKKRPEGSQPVNINVSNINLALERAREIRKIKLQAEPIDV
jgi:hypothetical protein